MALTQRVDGDYSNWSGSIFDQVDYEAYIESLGNSTNDRTGYMEKEFTLARAATDADLTLRSQGFKSSRPGSKLSAEVKIIKPDTSEVSLWSASGGYAKQYVLSSEDITAHLAAAGTYKIRIDVTVASGFDVFHYKSWVKFFECDISVDTVVSHTKTLTESLGLAETFAKVKGVAKTLADALGLIEHFDVQKAEALGTSEEKIVGGSGTAVKIFDVGAAEGTFDTDDLDMGMPGTEKTYDRVSFTSDSETPHTVSVYYSLDSGGSWTYAGQAVVQKGALATVFIWITAEVARLRFIGTSLNLSSHRVYAVPRGKDIAEDD